MFFVCLFFQNRQYLVEPPFSATLVFSKHCETTDLQFCLFCFEILILDIYT